MRERVSDESLARDLADQRQRDQHEPAAPIRDHSGQVTAAIGVAAPVQRMTRKSMQTAAPNVVAAAESISKRLGYLPSLSRAE